MTIQKQKSTNGKSSEFSGASQPPVTQKTPGNEKNGKRRRRKDQQGPSTTKKQEQFDMCSPNSLLCEMDLKVRIYFARSIIFTFSFKI